MMDRNTSSYFCSKIGTRHDIELLLSDFDIRSLCVPTAVHPLATENHDNNSRKRSAW